MEQWVAMRNGAGVRRAQEPWSKKDGEAELGKG